MADGGPVGTSDDRRAFLLKLAKTATYSAPLVRTLAAPTHVAAQGLSAKMMMNMMMGMMGMDVPTPFESGSPRAPWAPSGQQ